MRRMKKRPKIIKMYTCSIGWGWHVFDDPKGLTFYGRKADCKRECKCIGKEKNDCKMVTILMKEEVKR
jgi:hypothetical protein